MERFDLLHFIHKALRHAMLTFNIQSGRTDFTDPEAVNELQASWSRLRENLGHHAQHEDDIMFPLLRDRAPGEPREPFGWEGEVDALEEDHIRIQQLETELDKLLVRIEEAAEPATRQLLGRSPAPSSGTRRCASYTLMTKSVTSCRACGLSTTTRNSSRRSSRSWRPWGQKNANTSPIT